MKAVIYVRQSQDRQGDELGVTRQRDDARRLAELRGWTIVAERADNDLSAAGKRKRPGFEAVIAAIDAREVDAVVAWDMTRLSRNRRDTVRLMEAGEKAGVTLAFVRGSDLDLSTPAGRLTADILSGVSRHEIEVKSDRQRRAALQAAQQGRRIGGRRPFGYGLQVGVDERSGKPVLDYSQLVPEEARALRDAYDGVLHGVSLGRIAKDWNARGLHTPQGTRAGGPSKWTAQTVRPVLLNPRYCGLRTHVDAALRSTMHPVKARLAGIVGPAEWPAVVDQETWRAGVSILSNPERANPGRSGRRLLTGLARCGVCDALVHGGANPQRQPTYRCSAAYGHVGRRAEPVDEYVGEVVVARLSRPDATDLLAEPDRPDVGALRTELAALRARLDEQAALHAAGDIDTAQLRAGTALLRRRVGEVEGALADAGRVSVLGPLIGAPDVGAAWKALDADRQRVIIDRLMIVTLLPPGRGTRTFRPETVRIEPRGRGR